MANGNDTQGQSGLDNQTQLKLRFQIQQIQYIPWYSTYRIELTTQTSHKLWCCVLYHARAVTPDEHYLERRIRTYPSRTIAINRPVRFHHCQFRLDCLEARVFRAACLVYYFRIPLSSPQRRFFSILEDCSWETLTRCFHSISGIVSSSQRALPISPTCAEPLSRSRFQTTPFQIPFLSLPPLSVKLHAPGFFLPATNTLFIFLHVH
ncbi:hypothetical protein FPOA_00867 [Fusarium poae]|uniref:Uncharacterized protein n=1 Tax=Fusarium poae TaxID=36050 RepID=A0A1B8B2J0_FUSPO|nr:hypothetical protein FPOA_00867 [Fusarium poae]